jgi:glucoamylase
MCKTGLSMDTPHAAFGSPGIEPRWTHGGKEGVGTAYAASSRVWFTVWNGIVTEVYYPAVDRPQLRDLQLLITDGSSFFHEEKRHLDCRTERLAEHGLGYRCTNSDPAGRYSIVKTIIADPQSACVLQRIHVTGDESFLAGLRLYALCAPHLEVAGWGNNGYMILLAGRKILVAERKGTWLALGATVPFSRASCGYVGTSDGWTDLADNFQMDWEFETALDGNIALTGELDLTATREFTLALAFGHSQHHAVCRLLESLIVPFAEHEKRFTEQWRLSSANILPLGKFSGDGGNLYRSSFNLLCAHEDKSYPGAFIASLSIPWGEVVGDENQGGYHLVWTRDMVNTATAMLAAGDRNTPLRALIYLNVSQEESGGFSQNFWIDGEPYWKGVQLDETAYPILLAWRLKRENALQDFDPYPMVLRAAAYLVANGPLTPQERWEEVSGYSPSTLASNIAALICASCFAREKGDEGTAKYLEEYADFLECHIESWTATTEGTLLAGVTRHYIRIHPERADNPDPDEDPNHGTIAIANCPPGVQGVYPAKEIVDAGFLELVRHGIRRADDALVVDSLKVVDAVLKVSTPSGPCWHRYNHDSYGQRDDGGPFEGWGTGRAWPLLTGERAHYELAAGNDTKPFIRAMEHLASRTGLLPEQSWDCPDLPEGFMYFGRPTGSAMPLMWAHAEYIKLLRSVRDGNIFDRIPDVAARYLGMRPKHYTFEIWKPLRQVRSVKRGSVLRIQLPARFHLHWSDDEWNIAKDTSSLSTVLGVEYVDIPIASPQDMSSQDAALQRNIRFSIFQLATDSWDDRDYVVSIV